MKRKKTPFRPNQLVEPVQSCSFDADGVPYTFSSKSKPIRGDHPAVLAKPDLFRALEEDEPAETGHTARTS